MVWPSAIATLSGTTMLVRETTDHVSPLAVQRYSAGFRVSLLTSATGLCYLAHCPRSQWETLLDVLERAGDAAAQSRTRADWDQTFAHIRAQGYALKSQVPRGLEEVTMSVRSHFPTGCWRR